MQKLLEAALLALQRIDEMQTRTENTPLTLVMTTAQVKKEEPASQEKPVKKDEKKVEEEQLVTLVNLSLKKIWLSRRSWKCWLNDSRNQTRIYIVPL